MAENVPPVAHPFFPAVHAEPHRCCREIVPAPVGDRLAEHLGHRPDIVQTNVSVSARGTVRGIHFADVPPGQGKYVTALTGSLVDYVIDVRVGSPTFGQWEAVTLDTTDRRAVYLSEGLGHAFCALEDDTTAMYLCTATYNPTGEHGIHPLDAEVGLTLPDGIEPLLSAKDEAAPTLADAAGDIHDRLSQRRVEAPRDFTHRHPSPRGGDHAIPLGRQPARGRRPDAAARSRYHCHKLSHDSILAGSNSHCRCRGGADRLGA